MEDLYKYLKDTATVNPNVAVSLAIADASDDTQDATAVAADIKEGKTAYIATGKVTGTFKGVDTSDATAVAGDLLNGKTAYVNGSKVVGTIVSKEAQTYTPSSSEQVINAGQYLAGAQTIAAVPTEEKSATPSTAGQEVVPTAGKFLSKVTVSGDANLVAGNIKNGVSIFGVQGTLTSLDTSDADATAENIDSGKTAYVKGQKITGTSTKVNTSDANAVAGDIATGKTAYVNGVKLTGTHTCSPGLDTSDATATEGQILSGKTAYVNGEKVTGILSFGTTLSHQGSLSVSDSNVVTATTTLDSNFCIYSDGSTPRQARLTLTASQVAESIGLTADKLVSGNTVLGITGTTTAGVDTSDANATATDILTGKTAYVNGSKVTGTIPSVEAATITPGTLDQTISAGQYVAGAQTIKGEPNLLAENIKKDVAIFGVTGTYEATSTGIDTSDATATANQILQGATAYVKGAKVTGTYVPLNTSDANATAADIATGKTAYVNGQKITGTHTCAPTTVTAVYKGKVKDTSEITLQVDYRTAIMQSNFEFEGYTLAEGDVIMFPDNTWVSAVVATGGVEICNHSKSDEYALKGKECYVMSKAQVIQ